MLALSGCGSLCQPLLLARRAAAARRAVKAPAAQQHFSALASGSSSAMFNKVNKIVGGSVDFIRLDDDGYANQRNAGGCQLML